MHIYLSFYEQGRTVSSIPGSPVSEAHPCLMAAGDCAEAEYACDEKEGFKDKGEGTAKGLGKSKAGGKEKGGLKGKDKGKAKAAGKCKDAGKAKADGKSKAGCKGKGCLKGKDGGKAKDDGKGNEKGNAQGDGNSTAGGKGKKGLKGNDAGKAKGYSKGKDEGKAKGGGKCKASGKGTTCIRDNDEGTENGDDTSHVLKHSDGGEERSEPPPIETQVEEEEDGPLDTPHWEAAVYNNPEEPGKEIRTTKRVSWRDEKEWAAEAEEGHGSPTPGAKRAKVEWEPDLQSIPERWIPPVVPVVDKLRDRSEKVEALAASACIEPKILLLSMLENPWMGNLIGVQDEDDMIELMQIYNDEWEDACDSEVSTRDWGSDEGWDGGSEASTRDWASDQGWDEWHDEWHKSEGRWDMESQEACPWPPALSAHPTWQEEAKLVELAADTAGKVWSRTEGTVRYEPHEKGTPVNTSNRKRENAVFIRRCSRKNFPILYPELAKRFNSKAQRGQLFQDFMDSGMCLNTMVVIHRRRMLNSKINSDTLEMKTRKEMEERWKDSLMLCEVCMCVQVVNTTCTN